MKIQKSLKDFLKQSTSYVLFNLLVKLVPFILLPIIIRNISVEDYGSYSLFLTMETVLIPLLSFNLSNCLYREYYLNKSKIHQFTSNLFYGYVLLGLFFLIPYFVLVLLLKGFLGFSLGLFACLYITSFLFPFCDIITIITRLKQKPLYYGIWQFFRSVLLLSLLVVSLSFSKNYSILIYFRVIAFAFVFIVSLIILSYKKLLWHRFDRSILSYMIKFSAPTVIYSLSAFVFSFSDRFFIKGYLDTESLGIYSGIYQISSVLSILIVAMNAAWMPWLFGKLSSDNPHKKLEVVKISYFVILGFIFIGVLWGVLLPFISSFFLTPAYLSHMNLSWIFIFAFIMHGIYCVVSPYTYYTKRTKSNAKIGLLSAVSNVILNIIFTPIYGLYGPALSLFLTWTIQAVLFFIYSIKYYPLPWLLK